MYQTTWLLAYHYQLVLIDGLTSPFQNGHEEIVDYLADHNAKMDGVADRETWGSYFKDILTKSWTQTIRAIQLQPAEKAPISNTTKEILPRPV